MRTRLTALLAVLTPILLALTGTASAPAHAAAAAPVVGVVSIQPSVLEVGAVWTSTVLTTPDAATRDSYQWLRNGQPIAGATAPTYTATPADVAHALSLRVQVSAPGYAPTMLTSEAIDGIEEAELDTFEADRPDVMGSAKPGKTVRAKADMGAYDEDTKLTYQWKLNGKPAKKGTGQSFKLKKKHRGMMLSVEVTASEAGYETETVTSRPMKIKR